MPGGLYRSDALEGLTALVSGGANGIGKGISLALKDAGARVIVADLDEAAGSVLVQEKGIEFEQVDLTNFDAVEQLIDRVGHVDILVNNAGVDQHAYFTKTGPDDWDRLLRINLESAFALTKAVLQTMQAANFGRIVHIASEAGRQGSKGGSVYAAAKGGMIAFSKSLARENARFGITSNTICPGPIDTPLLRKAVAGGGGDALLSAMEGATLIGRLGQAEDVACACVFLASRQASYITGETLGVSGGMGCGS